MSPQKYVESVWPDPHMPVRLVGKMHMQGCCALQSGTAKVAQGAVLQEQHLWSLE